jgi:hypothetical protein
MTAAARHPVPPLGAVLAEQIRFVGLALRREAAIAAVVLLALLAVPSRDGPVNFSREIGVLCALLGAAAPFAVWSRLAGDGHLWTLPVDHRRHALVGVAAGWCWLMTAVAALLLWLAALVLLSGGDLLIAGPRLVLRPGVSAVGAVAPGDVVAVAWRTPAWVWVVPFTAATTAYLLGSALVLGTARPWRWAGGATLVVLLAVLLGDGGALGWLNAGLAAVAGHPYGVETVVAGGAVRLKTIAVRLATGETVRVWRDLPTAGRWAAATLLWTAAGAAALWLGTARRREREPRA